MAVVVDATVATLWFLPQARSDAARAWLTSGEELIAPPLLQLEVGTALLRSVRRGEAVAAAARAALFTDLPGAVRLVDPPDLARQAYGIAAERGGSFYDAVYIACARALGAALVTDDAQMRGNALREGVRARLLGDG